MGVNLIMEVNFGGELFMEVNSVGEFHFGGELWRRINYGGELFVKWERIVEAGKA